MDELKDGGSVQVSDPSPPGKQGELFRYLRRKAGMSLGDVARLIGSSVSAVSRLEHNEIVLETKQNSKLKDTEKAPYVKSMRCPKCGRQLSAEGCYPDHCKYWSS